MLSPFISYCFLIATSPYEIRSEDRQLDQLDQLDQLLFDYSVYLKNLPQLAYNEE